MNRFILIFKQYGPAAIGAILTLIIWEEGVKIFQVAPYILPAPSAILASGIKNADSLVQNGLVTLSEILLGFVLSIIIAVPLAIGIVYSRILESLIYPPLIASQSIPKIAIAPLFVLWFGFGTTSKVFVAFLIAFFPIVIDTVVGLKSLDENMIYLAKAMGASDFQVFTKFRLPVAMPNLFGGLKVAITLAVVGAITGEFVGADKGLGYLLLVANGNLDTRLLFADIALLTVIGLILFYAIGLAEKLFLPQVKRAKH